LPSGHGCSTAPSGATAAGGQSLDASAGDSVTLTPSGRLALRGANTGAGAVSPALTITAPGPLHLAGKGTYRGSLQLSPTATGASSRSTLSTWTMYAGVSAETPATDAAVVATRGQIVTYSGRPAVTYFFASSGGYTESIQNVWPSATPEPWLTGVPGPYDSAGEDTDAGFTTISTTVSHGVLAGGLPGPRHRRERDHPAARLGRLEDDRPCAAGRRSDHWPAAVAGRYRITYRSLGGARGQP
jgi:hypothetical protein